MHSVTDRQTDGQTDGQQAAGNSRSYCVAVRSAKNCLQVIEQICNRRKMQTNSKIEQSLKRKVLQAVRLLSNQSFSDLNVRTIKLCRNYYLVVFRYYISLLALCYFSIVVLPEHCIILLHSIN